MSGAVLSKAVVRAADQLGLRQAQLAKGVSALSTLARTLGVSLEELLGEESAAAAKRRGREPKLQQQMDVSNTCRALSSASSCRSSIPC